jgi:hypothetical protein
VAACVSVCGVCTGCRTACCTALSTHTTNWNTCCHNTAKLITMCFYWLILKKFNFSQAQSKLLEDGPSGPKHVGANIRYFNVNFKNFIWLIIGAFVGKKNFDFIKMHGTTIKMIKFYLADDLIYTLNMK